MNRLQIGVLVGSLLLFMGVYFGFDTKPPKQKAIEKSRSLVAETRDAGQLVKEARSSLAAVDLAAINMLEAAVQAADQDSAKAESLKELAGKWYELGVPAVSGYYAEEVAELTGTEEAWSIAGTTYAICVQRMEEADLKEFCNQRAIRSFENAISIKPSKTDHRVNLALCYTELPPADNPMKGVMMLRELYQQDPDNILVLTNLGRLAVQTGQYEKARERLERVIELAPEHVGANCLLAEVYDQLGLTEQATEFADRCKAGING